MSIKKGKPKVFRIVKFKSGDILMRKKRLWFAVATCFLTTFALFYLIQPKTLHFGTLIVLPLKKEPPCDISTTPIDKGCDDLAYGNYCVHSLPSDAERSNINLGSVTLCTQGTVGFLHHVSVLCERWGGPISVAVYSPPLDNEDTRALVASLRYCDFCVRHWVSWHFFGTQNFEDRYLFSGKPVISFEETKEDCSVLGSGNWTQKRKSEGPYPINVGRNLARQRTHTPYVFSVDIELYPSNNVLSKFERMIRFRKNTTSSEVWVLPVFEVHSGFPSPRTKFQLKQMFTSHQAISFHKYKCNICHMIPDLRGWLNKETQWKSEVAESTEDLRVFSTVKRSRKLRLGDWEPFFIGTKEDPEFDIRLSWEGKANKMQMAYEMCLRDYDFHIVENAFLVHAPGIRVYNLTRDRARMKYIRENKKYMKTIKKELKKMYGSSNDC
ncbi:hypothetical protein JTE90_000816 [Oedothorax gibbosus]|uniref:N-acetyllactosaminide beta-1,3-N-acetylglucosaminyltransferase n=1 Tax=Oedothorax gibbosus TaxID=931172 RepID=A0AAV6VVF3_9ARAC|nr:hypothetical protein JTE90_000816 [Oedothorax gibbosus]